MDFFPIVIAVGKCAIRFLEKGADTSKKRKMRKRNCSSVDQDEYGKEKEEMICQLKINLIYYNHNERKKTMLNSEKFKSAEERRAAYEDYCEDCIKSKIWHIRIGLVGLNLNT